MCSALRLGLGDQESQRLECHAAVDLGDLVQHDHVVAGEALHQPLTQSEQEPLDGLAGADGDRLDLLDDGVCPALSHVELVPFVVLVVVGVLELPLVEPLESRRRGRVDRGADVGLVVQTNPRHVTGQKIPARVAHECPLRLTHALESLRLVVGVRHVVSSSV